MRSDLELWFISSNLHRAGEKTSSGLVGDDAEMSIIATDLASVGPWGLIALTALPLLVRTLSSLLQAFLAERARRLSWVWGNRKYSLDRARPESVEEWLSHVSAEVEHDRAEEQQRHGDI
jgi:hypothetical protein